MFRGTNLIRLADFNQRVVLDAVRRARSGISRVELGELTGLTPQTISNIARRLIDNGLVREGTPVPAARGKPRIPLTIDPTGCYALGVHVDPARLSLVLLDLAGRVTRSARLGIPDAATPAQVIQLITKTSESLVRRSGIDPARVLGLGVAAPGPLDLTAGVLLDPPLLAGWHKVPLRLDLQTATGRPVLLDKDVTAAATAELRAARTDRQNFIFLYLGAGVGAGIVLDDIVVRGATNNIGEVGGLLVDPDAENLGWGRRGSLATACLPQALVQQAQRQGILGIELGASYADWDAGLGQLCELADAGQDAAAQLIHRSAMRVSTGIAAMVDLLDVDRVVLGGPSWSRMSSRYLAVLPGMVASQLVVPRPVAVEGSAVGEEVAAHGAAALVLDHDLTPRPSTLLME